MTKWKVAENERHLNSRNKKSFRELLNRGEKWKVWGSERTVSGVNILAAKQSIEENCLFFVFLFLFFFFVRSLYTRSKRIVAVDVYYSWERIRERKREKHTARGRVEEEKGSGRRNVAGKLLGDSLSLSLVLFSFSLGFGRRSSVSFLASTSACAWCTSSRLRPPRVAPAYTRKARCCSLCTLDPIADRFRPDDSIDTHYMTEQTDAPRSSNVIHTQTHVHV